MQTTKEGVIRDIPSKPVTAKKPDPDTSGNRVYGVFVRVPTYHTHRELECSCTMNITVTKALPLETSYENHNAILAASWAVELQSQKFLVLQMQL